MFRWVALISSILTWPLISFGALVRLKGAGLSCPDWPLCYGKVIPPPGFEIALEVGHRFIATILGIIIIVLVGLTFKPQYKQYRTLAVGCLVLVSLQGILGGLTVIMKLSPPTVIFHLIGGNLLFGLLIYLAYTSFYDVQHTKAEGQNTEPRPAESKSFSLSRFSQAQIWMFAIFLVILISGGANSSTYSGYACNAFPGCQPGSTFSFYVSTDLEGGYFFPRFWNEGIHMLHRLIAILGALIIVLLSWSFLLKHSDSTYHKIGFSILGLLFLEIVVGIINALYQVPVPISLAHTAIAATLIGVLSFSFVRSIHRNH